MLGVLGEKSVFKIDKSGRWAGAGALKVTRPAPVASGEPTVEALARSCELKAAVVRDDEFETTGLRAILNYGHTFAHAFEALSGYDELLHGEAVSIGMVCASRLAEKAGRVSRDATTRQIELLKAVGLPVDVPAGQLDRRDEIVRCMQLDKKTLDGQLRFILPDRIGHVELVDGITADALLWFVIVIWC